MTVSIISYSDKYKEKSTELLGQLIEAERQLCDEWPQQEALYQKHFQFLLDTVEQQDGEIHLALENDQPVGLIAVYTEQDPEGSLWPAEGKQKFGFISDIVVDKSQFGTGLAEELIARAEDYCRRKGFNTLQLDFIRGNARAHKFYQKNGFSDYMVVSRKNISLN